MGVVATGVQLSFSFTSRGPTVTDWTPPVIASGVVQLPSQPPGGSSAMPPELVTAQVSALAVTVAGSAHEPVEGWHAHAPHTGGGGGATPR